ncbi:MAG: PP2C family serine/threonine-protein phosphatase [Paracoccaceae bacterium]
MTFDQTTLQCRFSARTHKGHVRQVNEDAILSAPEMGLWAIADGMGGHTAGDVASQTVIAALDGLPRGLEPAELMNNTRTALYQAHGDIRDEAVRRGGATIGATAVVLLIAEEHFLCLWAGDSRLYRLRDGALQMLSADHSVVGELVEAGQITWAEADKHPHANQITRAVGVGPVLDIDKRRGAILPGDRFLLCSDGLTKYATDPVIAAMLANRTIDTVANALLQIALDGGGADNISVIVVEV